MIKVHYYQVHFCHVPIQVSQDGFMLRLICMFLSCDLPIQLLLKLLSSEFDDRLEDRFHHVEVYWFTSRTTKICNSLCLNKYIDLHIFLPVIYQYSCLLCVNKLLLISAWHQALLNISIWIKPLSLVRRSLCCVSIAKCRRNSIPFCVWLPWPMPRKPVAWGSSHCSAGIFSAFKSFRSINSEDCDSLL